MSSALPGCFRSKSDVKSAHSDGAFSVPVPSITERKRGNSDAFLELSEAQGLVILNLTHSCLRCDKRVPSVGHANLSVFASGPLLVLEQLFQIHLRTPAPPASDTGHFRMDGFS